MTRKEAMDLILSKVDESKREAFVKEFRETKTKKERLEIVKKFGVALTEEEVAKIKAGNELSDEELDKAAGGCCGTSCSYNCFCDL